MTIAHLVSGLPAVMIEAALRAALVAATVEAAIALFRIRHAGLRSAMTRGGLIVSLAMPVLMWATPQIFLRAAQAAAPSVYAASPHAAPAAATAEITQPARSPHADIMVPTAQSARHAATPVSSTPISHLKIDWLAFAYLVIAGVGVTRIAYGLAVGEKLRRRAKPIRLAVAFDLRESQSVRVPMTFGWPSTSVILPETWKFWDEGKLAAVLHHEGAHVRRADFLFNALANLNAALFWFSPIAWLQKSRLAALSEHACDDCAIAAVGDGAAYADVLLSFAGRTTTPALSLSMARGEISRRIERALDGSALAPRRTPAAVKLGFAAILAAAAYGAAAVTLAEAPAKSAVKPVVKSATAAVPTPPPAPKPAPLPHPAPAAKPIALLPPVTPAPHVAPLAPLPPPDTDALLAGGDDGDGASVVTTDNDDDTYSWSRDAHGRNESLTISRDRIEYAHDDKSYVITDKATLARARVILQPSEDLGRKQEALGRAQEKLGAKQEKLSERQEEAEVEAGDLQEKFRDKMNELEEFASRPTLSQSEIGEMQSRLGDLQGALGELQARAAAGQASLSQSRSQLGAEQAELGRRQAELGRQQEAASRLAYSQIRELIDNAIRSGIAEEE